MSAHRRTRSARPIAGHVALAGLAFAGLSAVPGTTVAVSTPMEVAQVPTLPTAPDHGDALWYGLLSTAALAGAAGAHQLVGRPRRV